MSSLLLALFTDGIRINGVSRLLWMLPLCLSIAVVYKATRCNHMREVPVAALALWLTIVIGMYAVGIGLWVTFQIAV